MLLKFQINFNKLHTFLYAISNNLRLACCNSFVCLLISSGSVSSFLANVPRIFPTKSLSLSHYK